MTRIVLTTFGSLGDLHPYLALALELKARGFEVAIATNEYYRQKIEALGLPFYGVRPDLPDPVADADLLRQLIDLQTGIETVIRKVLMPVLRESYADLTIATAGADLLISHSVTLAGRLVAEKQGIRWVSGILQPIGFFSAYDPPVLPVAPMLKHLRSLGPGINGLLLRGATWISRSWVEPWHQLRAELGLPATNENPLFEGQHSPELVLALFSDLLATQQPDFPPQTVITGFPFYDQPQSLPEPLKQFLEAGNPPIVFTLGTSAVMTAGDFYEISAAVAQRLNRRAVLLVGSNPRNRPTGLTNDVIAVEYAPFAQLFPAAAAIVHQGGIGTTAEAMRAGRPMLVVPFSHDQPDNAARVERLGMARTLYPADYSVERAAAELSQLLSQPTYAERARLVGKCIHQENGVRVACDAIEALLNG